MIIKSIHDEEELQNMTAEDLRAYIVDLANYAEQLEEEREDLREQLNEERATVDAITDDGADACDDIAEAVETFAKYNDEAGGEWYKKDLSDFFLKLSQAVERIAPNDWRQTSARITSAAPLY